jgi:uncharacterized protein
MDDLSRPGGVVRELFSYPIKGCAGVSLTETVVTPAGLAHDRSFMVVNPDGVFRSQRRDPRLAVIRPQLGADGCDLTLHAPGIEPVHLLVDLDGPRRDVLLFRTPFRGLDQGDTVAAWLSYVLGAPSRLVRVPPDHDRLTDGQTPGTSGYADSSAVHLVSMSSLDLLNRKLLGGGHPPLPMSRFRPNIVIDGWATPHAEDHVRRGRVGTVELGYTKVAIRCVVTTVDQRTGGRSGPEPLRTLATYRRLDTGLAFGAKFAVTRAGRVGVGDEIDVHRWETPEDTPTTSARSESSPTRSRGRLRSTGDPHA